MKFSRYSLILFFILGICSLSIFAQNSGGKIDCPTFSVSAPSKISVRGETLTFRLISDKNFNTNIKLRWSISFGKIISGQGTQSITVETDARINEITTVVEVIGLPENCQQTAQAFLHSDYLKTPLAAKVDEFRVTTNKNLSQKIISLSEKLRTDPSTTISIIKSFTGKPNKLSDYLYLQSILNYLKDNGIEEERVTFQIYPEKVEVNEFWIVPAGAELPLSNIKHERLNAVELKQRIVELCGKP